MSKIHLDKRIVIEKKREELGDGRYCYFIKSQRWVHLGCTTARCGETSKIEKTHTTSIEIERSMETSAELGVSFEVLSAKVLQKYGITITKMEETTVREDYPLPSAKCTVCYYDRYQLVSYWDVEPHTLRRRHWYSIRKQDIPDEPYIVKVNENFIDFILSAVSSPESCPGCLPDQKLSSNATFEVVKEDSKYLVNLPCKLVEGKKVLLSDSQIAPLSEDEVSQLDQLINYLPATLNGLSAQLLSAGKKLSRLEPIDLETRDAIQQFKKQIKEILSNTQYEEHTGIIMSFLPILLDSSVTNFDLVQKLKDIRKDLPTNLTPEQTKNILLKLNEVEMEISKAGSLSRSELETYLQKRMNDFLQSAVDEEQKKIAQSIYGSTFQVLYPLYEGKKVEILGYAEGYIDLVTRLIQKNRIEWVYHLVDIFIRELETNLDIVRNEFEKAKV